jgi:hypothetical protein
MIAGQKGRKTNVRGELSSVAPRKHALVSGAKGDIATATSFFEICYEDDPDGGETLSSLAVSYLSYSCDVVNGVC